MLRPIWRPPRLQNEVDNEQEHRATWLELLYDVVYVATLTQLSAALTGDLTVAGFLRFLLLFTTIWWSWSDITFYMNRFIVDDFWHRILIFGQIFAISILAISLTDAFGGLSTQFLLAYLMIRFILVILYFRAGRHNEHVRPLTNWLMGGYAVGALIWLVSLFVPPPARYAIWIVGIAAEMLVPFLPGVVRNQAAFPSDEPHLVERYGLFTIIVLGDAFLRVITETSGSRIGLEQIVFSIFGLIVIYALWWLYFGDVSVSKIKPGVLPMYIWTYAHFPLAVGVSAVAVASRKLFLEPLASIAVIEHRVLYTSALVIYLAALALINLMTEREDDPLPAPLRAAIRVGGALMIGGVGLLVTNMTVLALMVLMVLVFAAQVAVDVITASRATPEESKAAENEQETPSAHV